MMNSYFEQSGFYGGHGQTGAEQAYRFPLGLGVNPYGPPSGGVTRQQVDSYDQSTAAAAAASCKLYEQQYKLDCSKADQNGYSSAGINVKSDNNSAISSWARRKWRWRRRRVPAQHATFATTPTQLGSTAQQPQHERSARHQQSRH